MIPHVGKIHRLLAQLFRKNGFSLLLLLLSGLLAGLNSLQAQGNLLLTPKRILFEGSKTTESINLVNSGNDTAQYVISIIHHRMKEDGAFEEISLADAGKSSAEPYLRFFPRSVLLAPGEAQVIRMQFNRPALIENGEYRSHLYVRAIPKSTPLGEKESIEGTPSISVKLIPVFGISIPVIIRVGESNVHMSLSDLQLTTDTTDQPLLRMDLNRSGNMSIYGDITVTYIDNQGRATVAGVVRGLAVYTPNAVRHIVLSLIHDGTIDYHTGKLTVQFRTRGGDDGKNILTTEAELALR